MCRRVSAFTVHLAARLVVQFAHLLTNCRKLIPQFTSKLHNLRFDSRVDGSCSSSDTRDSGRSTLLSMVSGGMVSTLSRTR